MYLYKTLSRHKLNDFIFYIRILTHFLFKGAVLCIYRCICCMFIFSPALLSTQTSINIEYSTLDLVTGL